MTTSAQPEDIELMEKPAYNFPLHCTEFRPPLA